MTEPRYYCPRCTGEVEPDASDPQTLRSIEPKLRAENAALRQENERITLPDRFDRAAYPTRVLAALGDGLISHGKAQEALSHWQQGIEDPFREEGVSVWDEVERLRAAVAPLVEAAQQVYDECGAGGCPSNGAMEKLFAALAKAKEGK